MHLNSQQQRDLERYMRIVFALYNLSPESQKMARIAATNRSVAAWRCYGAIVRSL